MPAAFERFGGRSLGWEKSQTGCETDESMTDDGWMDGRIDRLMDRLKDIRINRKQRGRENEKREAGRRREFALCKERTLRASLTGRNKNLDYFRCQIGVSPHAVVPTRGY